MASHAFRRIRGYKESDRDKVIRLVMLHGFEICTGYNPGEMDVTLAFGPDFAAKLNALQQDLRDLDEKIRIV